MHFHSNYCVVKVRTVISHLIVIKHDSVFKELVFNFNSLNYCSLVASRWINVSCFREAALLSWKYLNKLTHLSFTSALLG